MNQRIKELAEQAGIKEELVVMFKGDKRAYVLSKDDVEKFAELIVDECMLINRQRLFPDYEGDSHRVAHNNALLCANSDLREYFGVEE